MKLHEIIGTSDNNDVINELKAHCLTPIKDVDKKALYVIQYDNAPNEACCTPSELYPYFDETGDMIAFSRSFSRSIGGVKTTYFETFTDEEHWLWVQGENGMEVVEGYPKKISIG